MFSVYKSKSENLSTFENLSTLDLSTASLRPPDGSNNWSDRSNFFVRPYYGTVTLPVQWQRTL